MFPRRNLALLLLQAREAVMTRFRPLIAEEGLTEQQWRILRALSECSPLEPGQIAEVCSILSPSLTGILARMEAADLVARAQSTADQRRQSVALTPRSRMILARMAPRIEAEYRRLESDWGVDTVTELVGMLDRVLAKAVPAEAIPGAARPAARERRTMAPPPGPPRSPRGKS
jgi:homoprotocatechuate degradation regulator HpaR